MCCCDEHEIANCKWQTANCKFEIRNAQFAILAFTLTLSRRLRGRRSRRGQALVEFAVVALVVYLLLGAMLTFGQWFYSGQTVQQAADASAREISRTPLLATANLMDVLYSNNPSDYSSSGGSSTVRTSLFNPQLLQFDMTANVPAGQSVLDVVRTWPIVNQLLYPAMIVQSGEQVYGGSASDLYLCYPGVVPCTDSTNPNRTVYCVARVRQPRRRRCGVDHLGAGHRGNHARRVFRGIAAGRAGVAADQLRLPVGLDEPPFRRRRPTRRRPTLPRGWPTITKWPSIPRITRPSVPGLHRPSAPIAGPTAWERRRPGPDGRKRTPLPPVSTRHSSPRACDPTAA